MGWTSDLILTLLRKWFLRRGGEVSLARSLTDLTAALRLAEGVVL